MWIFYKRTAHKTLKSNKNSSYRWQQNSISGVEEQEKGKLMSQQKKITFSVVKLRAIFLMKKCFWVPWKRRASQYLPRDKSSTNNLMALKPIKSKSKHSIKPSLLSGLMFIILMRVSHLTYPFKNLICRNSVQMLPDEI